MRGSGPLLATEVAVDTASQRMIPLPLIVTEEETGMIVDRPAAMLRHYEAQLHAAGSINGPTG